ncbi:hypothetical protein QVD17_29751 [Tagetes erecta]|uniref:Uncharacterized protein n=1 Tax=Tagetes erecta TaxID=13708 RepID=A0AAD8K1J5_TARER|nr:hypothetical protein QVD17_29751 [Tagetes erecta]
MVFLEPKLDCVVCLYLRIYCCLSVSTCFYSSFSFIHCQYVPEFDATIQPKIEKYATVSAWILKILLP